MQQETRAEALPGYIQIGRLSINKGIFVAMRLRLVASKKTESFFQSEVVERQAGGGLPSTLDRFQQMFAQR